MASIIGLANSRAYFISFALCLLSLFAAACGPNQKILNSADNASTPVETTTNGGQTESRPNTVDHDIQAMKNADFNFIFVFRRKDGGVMDAEDKKFFNVFTPAETNRRRLSDGGRAIIVGANFRWEPDVIKKFNDRFAMENHSKPESELPGVNVNANANF